MENVQVPRPLNGSWHLLQTAQRAALPDPLNPLRSPARLADRLYVSSGLKSTKCGATMWATSASLLSSWRRHGSGLIDSAHWIELPIAVCAVKKTKTTCFGIKNYAKRCLSHFTFRIDWNTHSKRRVISQLIPQMSQLTELNSLLKCGWCLICKVLRPSTWYKSPGIRSNASIIYIRTYGWKAEIQI